MSELDPIFAEYPLEGFQDIWFFELEPDRAIALYEVVSGERYHDDIRARLEGWDIDCTLAPFEVHGVELSDIGVRIERGEFAVDFYNGLDYWTHERQRAFIDWLREICRHVPEARLAWAHEGFPDRPSPQQTALLRRALGAPSE